MTDNRRECSFLGAVAELAFPIIYTTLHHNGADSSIGLRNIIALERREPVSISLRSTYLTGWLDQSLKIPRRSSGGQLPKWRQPRNCNTAQLPALLTRPPRFWSTSFNVMQRSRANTILFPALAAAASVRAMRISGTSARVGSEA